MKLYLISDDIAVRGHWIGVFGAADRAVLTGLSAEIEKEAIVFVDDAVLLGADPLVLEGLFAHRLLVLSKTPSFNESQKYLGMGAMGYANAMMHESHLRSAFEALKEGKVWLHPDFIAIMISQIRDADGTTRSARSRLDVLSAREREVALMLGEGKMHQEIAEALHITVRTVKAHAASIYHKLDVKDRLALSLLLHS